MKQLTRLKKVELDKITSIQTSDGGYTKTYTFVNFYKCIVQELSDAIDASIYGSNISKMLRISSVANELEQYLLTKLNTSSDNISKYLIGYSNANYKIVSVKSKYIDCERI